MSFHATKAQGRKPVWCPECRVLPASPSGKRRIRRKNPRQDPEVYVALRLATYSAASRLALCHLERKEYPEAIVVLKEAML